MEPEILAQKINKAISAYAKATTKLVVAIDGYSGIGKTTLLKSLAKNNKEILPVFIDDFILTGKSRLASIRKAKDKSKVFELKWNNVKMIKQLIHKFRTSNQLYSIKIYNPKTNKYDTAKTFDLSRKVLVLEGIFLFHPKLFKNIFDVRIYLDTDTKKADERRVRREKKRWGKKYFSEDHPDSFVRLFKVAYARYVKQYQPSKLADLVLKV